MARGSIKKRSESSWTIIYDRPPDPVTGKRRQKWEAVEGTKRDAEKLLAQRLAEVNTGMYADSSQMTLSDFLRRWLEDYASQRLKESTYTSYEAMIRNHVLPTLGSHKIEKLQPMHLQSLYKEKSKSLSARSVEYMHSILRSALNQAVKWGVISRNPTDRVDPPRPKKAELDCWDNEQVRQFLEYTEGERLHTLYRLALSTGMRRGELLGLRWQDIGEDSLRVRQTLSRSHSGEMYFDSPKTSASIRTIPLSESDMKALRQHRAQQAEERLKLGSSYEDNGLVFCTQLGTPINPSNLYRQFKRLVRESRLPEIRFHDLRHTHATMLLGAGIHPKIAQERLGHSQISVVLNTYSHALPTMQRDATEKIDEILR